MTTTTEPHLSTLARAVLDLGELALTFGRIDRTAVYHPDGAPESDTDHTVMLGWLGCALAARYFPGLDPGLIAQFALVHDAPEAYAGDTPTLRITADERAAKAAREAAAVKRLCDEYGNTLPWLPRLLLAYEAQILPEARFVRGLDKILPKIVHLLDGCKGLHEQDMSPGELAEVFERQAADMAAYVGEFTELMALRAELVAATVALHSSTLPPRLDGPDSLAQVIETAIADAIPTPGEVEQITPDMAAQVLFVYGHRGMPPSGYRRMLIDLIGKADRPSRRRLALAELAWVAAVDLIEYHPDGVGMLRHIADRELAVSTDA